MNKNWYIKMLLGLVSGVIFFHFLVLIKVIPFQFAWGGKIQNDGDMYILETVSIMVNFFLGLILLIKGHYIRLWLSERAIDKILWCFLVLFLLNTIGNLFAETIFEKAMSVLTLIFSFLIWKILKPKQTSI